MVIIFYLIIKLIFFINILINIIKDKPLEFSNDLKYHSLKIVDLDYPDTIIS